MFLYNIHTRPGHKRFSIRTVHYLYLPQLGEFNTELVKTKATF
jgi:hypothetical protein